MKKLFEKSYYKYTTFDYHFTYYLHVSDSTTITLEFLHCFRNHSFFIYSRSYVPIA